MLAALRAGGGIPGTLGEDVGTTGGGLSSGPAAVAQPDGGDTGQLWYAASTASGMS